MFAHAAVLSLSICCTERLRTCPDKALRSLLLWSGLETSMSEFFSREARSVGPEAF